MVGKVLEYLATIKQIIWSYDLPAPILEEVELRLQSILNLLQQED